MIVKTCHPECATRAKLLNQLGETFGAKAVELGLTNEEVMEVLEHLTALMSIEAGATPEAVGLQPRAGGNA